MRHALCRRSARRGTIDAHERCLNKDEVDALIAAIPVDPARQQRRLIKKAVCRGTTFKGRADFSGVTFVEEANFAGAQFPAGADFTGAAFKCDANFGRVQFGDVRFAGTDFRQAAYFGSAVFNARVVFNSAKFCGNATFSQARFVQAGELRPDFIDGEFAFDKVVCEEHFRVFTRPTTATFEGAQFRGGVDLFLEGGDVSFADTDFVATSLVTGAGSRVPQVNSLRRAKVAELTVSGVDLRPCRFIGAFGLDALQLESARFLQPPPGWRFRLRRQHWTRRQTLAEEHHWRESNGHGPGWSAGDGKPEPPQEIAAAYRALRKGLEERKDQPGAADFYYGEMEMRRRATGSAPGAFSRVSSAAERGLLWGYWAVSGYALRASRALMALLVVIVLCTSAFDMYGFQDRVRPYARAAEVQPERPDAQPADFPPSLADVVHGWGSFEAWTYSAGTAVAVIGAPESQLTQYGRGIRIGLRILGPILLGLALLSIRGRVKR
jgi:uncharacterized protein YjbI with pentapeptide repeats